MNPMIQAMAGLLLLFLLLIFMLGVIKLGEVLSKPNEEGIVLDDDRKETNKDGNTKGS